MPLEYAAIESSDRRPDAGILQQPHDLHQGFVGRSSPAVIRGDAGTRAGLIKIVLRAKVSTVPGVPGAK